MGNDLVREGPKQKDAYRQYLRLGVTRSFDALHDRLMELWGEKHAPSANTLRHWAKQFGWGQRVLDDDKDINQIAVERIKQQLAQEAEERRQRRLHISDIQQQQALLALTEREVMRDARGRPVIGSDGKPQETGRILPANLTSMDPSMIRAINDTIRVANDTQRLDNGEATARIVADELTVNEQVTRILGDEAIAEFQQFLGVVQNPEGDYDIDIIEGEVVESSSTVDRRDDVA